MSCSGRSAPSRSTAGLISVFHETSSPRLSLARWEAWVNWVLVILGVVAAVTIGLTVRDIVKSGPGQR